MHIEVVETSYFHYDGRGPELRRWLHDRDLFFPESEDTARYPGAVVGAAYDLPGGESAWVVFHGLQVLQVVPEEVHAYWHVGRGRRRTKETGVHRVVGSPWLAGFHPRRLGHHEHFILEWYDDIAEVICRELVFGPGELDLAAQAARDPRFARAYLRRGELAVRRGAVAEGIADLERFCAMAADEADRAYGRRLIASARASGPGA